MDAIAAALIYLVTSVAAFAILIQAEKRHSKSLGRDVTNGDVVFNAMIALVPGVGMAVALLIKATVSYGPSVTNWAGRKNRAFNVDPDE